MAITAPYISWTPRSNPVFGKLKLQSMERANIFFEEWLHFIFYDGGIDNRGALFTVSPYNLHANYNPKKVEAPVETTIVKGLYQDSIGERLKRDVNYTIKVFVWVETEEDADGVVFDFQEEQKEQNVKEIKNS